MLQWDLQLDVTLWYVLSVSHDYRMRWDNLECSHCLNATIASHDRIWDEIEGFGRVLLLQLPVIG